MMRQFGGLGVLVGLSASLLAQAPPAASGAPPLLDPGWTSTSFPKQEWAVSKVPEAEALAKQAQQELNVGRMNAAVPLLQKAIELDPAHPFAYWRLGSAQLPWEHNSGVALMKRQTEAAPSATAFKHAGFILRLSGFPEEAIPFFRDGSTKFPDDRELPALLGETLIAVQAYDEAIRVLTAQVERYPNSGRLHLFLGRALIRNGQPAAAQPHVVKAADLEPTATMGTLTANTLAEAGMDLDRALMLARRSVSLTAARMQALTMATPLPGPERLGELLAAWASVARVQLKRGELADARAHAESVFEFTFSADKGVLLGQIEDAAQRPSAAADAYAKAMAVNRSMPSLEAASRLAALLPTADERAAAIIGGQQALSRLQNVSVSRTGDLSTVTANVAMLLDRTGRVTDVATRGQTGAPGAADAIAATIIGRVLSHPAPSGPDLKLFRQGSLTCPQGQATCRLLLFMNQTISSGE